MRATITDDTPLRLEKLFVDLLESGQGETDYFTTRSRGGIFSPALTMFTMVCQRATDRRTLVGALEGIAAGAANEIISRNPKNRRAQFVGISSNSGGYSRARSKLSLETVKRISQLIGETLIARAPSEGLWNGRQVYLIDGTTFSLSGSAANKQTYRPTKNQHRESYTCEMMCTCVHSLTTGIALSPAYGPYRGEKAIGEVSLALQMIGQLPPGGLLVADRGFGGVFSLAYHAGLHDQEILTRLSETRAASINGGPAPRTDVDKEVTWRPKQHYLEKHPEIPASATITGRFIKRTIRRKGHRPLPLMFFTTAKDDAKELVALYQKRECIENDIRSLKYAIGLEYVQSRTPDMVAKELLLGVVAYNLLRAVIAASAKKLGVEPRRISFTRAAAFIKIFGEKLLRAESKQEHDLVIERFLTALRQSKLPIRRRQRIEPRKVVRKNSCSR